MTDVVYDIMKSSRRADVPLMVRRRFPSTSTPCRARCLPNGLAPCRRYVAAALLHDIGHMVSAEGEHPAERGIDALHERIGQKYLRRWFGPDVTEPVALHVAAKRYLCAAEPDYRAALSPASERSLMLQGGPFTPSEMTAFLQGPYSEAAIALRRWDDGAKVPGIDLTPLKHFEPFLRQVLKRADA